MLVRLGWIKLFSWIHKRVRNLILARCSNCLVDLVENTLSKNFKIRTNTGFLSKLLVVFLPIVAAGIISGCAGTAKGKDTSSYSKLGTEEVSSQESSEASAMVVIRYPAMIHANAENLYVSSFSINAIGGDVPYGVHGNRQTSRVA